MYRRRTMTTKVSHNLPEEYKEVSYIGANGSQFLSLDFELNSAKNAEVEVKFKGYVTGAIFGAGLYGLHTATTGYINEKLYYNGVVYQFNKADGVVLFNKSGFFYNKQRFINGLTFNSNNSKTAFFAFAQLQQGTRTYTSRATVKIGYIRLTSNSYNYYLIPCVRKSDNKPGMYDIVNGNFHTNQGEGEFIV